jgi:hypothetical protein
MTNFREGNTNVKVHLDGAIFVAHCMQFLLLQQKLHATRWVGVATISTFATILHLIGC